MAVTGVVLSDQIKSLDWRARQAKLADQLPKAELADVFAKVRALLFEAEI
jgi:mRNA interferase MazF